MPLLSRLLLNAGQVTREQLAKAIEHQVLYGGRIGTNLIELGFVSEADLAQALSQKSGSPTVDAAGQPLDVFLVDKVGKDRCERFRVFPHSLQSKTLHLLMVDPSDHAAKAAISYATGCMVKPYVIPEYRMLELLERYCGVPPQWRYEDRRRDYIARASRPLSGAGKAAGEGPLSPEIPQTPLSFEEASAALEQASTRDEVIRAALRLAAGYARRAAFYIVRKNLVIGWDCLGEGMDLSSIRSQVLPLSEPSIFQTVHDNPGPFMGKIPRTAANDLFRKSIEKRSGSVLVLPVRLADRIVNLLYLDNGTKDDVRPELKDLLLFVNKLPEAYLRIIQRRIQEDLEEGK